MQTPFDMSQFDKNARIAGVDEVGRGPLVGSVVAAAVILDPNNPIDGLRDSKKLSQKKRDALEIEIKNKALSWCLGSATAQEIDQINILQASLLAMQRAVEGLSIEPDWALVDGNKLPQLNCQAQAIVKGDDRVPAISAASILAKQARDREMLALAKRYPEYGFERHKGYPTKEHLALIRQIGFTEEYRMSFKPIRALLQEQNNDRG